MCTNAQVRALTTIAVDLTPVLPGGENGGAKVFVLELLPKLAEIAPDTQFVLLTHAASHRELTSLDGVNMRRLTVIGAEVARDRSSSHITRRIAKVREILPARLRRLVGARPDSPGPEHFGSRPVLSDIGADLLFCPFTAPTYSEPGIPIVCTIHDLQYQAYPEFFSSEDIAHRHQIFLDACRRASALSAVSDHARQCAIDHGQLDPESIRTIHHRIAHRLPPKAEEAGIVLRRLGLTPQRYLIYPANFWKHKNHEMLLTAFGIACRGGLGSDVKLVCTGSPGVRQAWLEKAADIMGMGDRVLFPGFLPDAELGALIAQAGGVVFPSLFEGFGLPVIEAMAAGVPVACSNTTALPEVAGRAAILFDPRIPDQVAESMVAVVEDRARRTWLITAGRERAADFSDARRMAEEYWHLFQFAASVYEPSDMLSGLYPDGWTGHSVSVEVAPAESEQMLVLDFFAPPWLPHDEVRIDLTYRFPQRMQMDQTKLGRGDSTTLRLQLPASGGVIGVYVTPSFIPALLGFGDDQRHLCVMLRQCVIERGADCRVLLGAPVAAS